MVHLLVHLLSSQGVGRLLISLLNTTALRPLRMHHFLLFSGPLIREDAIHHVEPGGITCPEITVGITRLLQQIIPVRIVQEHCLTFLLPRLIIMVRIILIIALERGSCIVKVYLLIFTLFYSVICNNYVSIFSY